MGAESPLLEFADCMASGSQGMSRRFVSFVEHFERSVQIGGDTLAVKDACSSLSYAALDALARAFARRLGAAGIGRGDTVVVHGERSVHAVAAVLGIWRVGACFVPVSRDTPPARLAHIAEDAGARVILSDARSRIAAQASGLDVIALEAIDGEHAHARAAAASLAPDDIAYVIYTSGTSGTPKGVVIEHGSLVRRYADWDQAFGLSTRRLRILQVAKLGFDVFLGDLVKALGSGGSLIVCPAEAVLDPCELYRWLTVERIDYVDVVPSVLRVLIEYMEQHGLDLAAVEAINCGADQWTPAEYRRFKRVSRVARLYNSYGVTECTVENTLFEDRGADLEGRASLPIGRPLASDEIILVDEALQPVATGEIGEICIGGPCVARGYLNRPDLNARAFFTRADPSDEPIRYYRSGDYGRYGADGLLEFQGRADSQIKIHGHRVEIEEIENVFERIPELHKVIVCFARARLLGYVQLRPGAVLRSREWIDWAARLLPRHMLPLDLIEVDRFPMNQNGKIDKTALVAGETAAPTLPPRRRKRPHDLHLSRNVDELQQRLEARGIDLIALVAEFVKPSWPCGVLIGGSLADSVATGVSDLDILVLLSDKDALKKRKREVFGNPVQQLPSSGDTEFEVSMFIEGIEIDIEFVVRPDVWQQDAQPEMDAKGIDSPRRVKFLSRLGSEWVVQGADVVERWRRYFQLEHFRIKRIMAEFTTASKNLEDLEAGIGLEKGHVGVVGIYVVTAMLRALLFCNGYHGCASKWMRVVGRKIETVDAETRDALIAGRALMFPGLLANADEELAYFREVYAFCKAIRRLLSREEDISNAIDAIVYELDIAL